MKIRYLTCRLALGLVIGVFSTLAFHGAGAHIARVMLPIVSQHVTQANAASTVNCDPGVCCVWQDANGNSNPPRFDGVNESVSSSAGEVSAQITTNTAGNMCLPTSYTAQWGNAYWPMLNLGVVGNCAIGAFAQTGWLNNKLTSPHMFWERGNKNADPQNVCAPSPILGLSVSGIHTYDVTGNHVSTSLCQRGFEFYYKLDGTVEGTQCADWITASNIQVFQEGDLQQVYTGSENFRNLAYCAQPDGTCSTLSNLAVTCTQYRGCSGSLANPYGCFARRQLTGSIYNGFDVWDQRTTGTGTC